MEIKGVALRPTRVERDGEWCLRTCAWYFGGGACALYDEKLEISGRTIVNPETQFREIKTETLSCEACRRDFRCG